MKYSLERYNIYKKYKNSGNYNFEQLKEIDLGLETLTASDVEFYAKNLSINKDGKACFWDAKYMRVLRLGLELGFNLNKYYSEMYKQCPHKALILHNLIKDIILDYYLTSEEKENKINLIVMEN